MGVASPCPNPLPNMGVASPCPTPLPNMGVASPCPTPLPNMGVASPCPTPLPNMGVASPCPTPMPNMGVASPCPTPLPNMGVASPCPTPLPNMGMASPCPTPLPNMGMASPCPTPLPNMGMASPCPTPLPNMGMASPCPTPLPNMGVASPCPTPLPNMGMASPCPTPLPNMGMASPCPTPLPNMGVASPCPTPLPNMGVASPCPTPLPNMGVASPCPTPLPNMGMASPCPTPLPNMGMASPCPTPLPNMGMASPCPTPLPNMGMASPCPTPLPNMGMASPCPTPLPNMGMASPCPTPLPNMGVASPCPTPLPNMGMASPCPTPLPNMGMASPCPTPLPNMGMASPCPTPLPNMGMASPCPTPLPNMGMASPCPTPLPNMGMASPCPTPLPNMGMASPCPTPLPNMGVASPCPTPLPNMGVASPCPTPLPNMGVASPCPTPLPNMGVASPCPTPLPNMGVASPCPTPLPNMGVASPCPTPLPNMGVASLVKLWADAFGRDLHSLATKYSGSRLLQKKYKDVEPRLQIQEVDGSALARRFSEDMGGTLRSKVEAVQRLVEAAEEADLNHEFNASLVFDYYNSVLINERDEKGNPVELGAEFLLRPNAHFGSQPVNTSRSSVQLPTSLYHKDPDILNGIYMSEALNPVFVENFRRDPTLTWQYFGSSTGFFRIYPGVKWAPDENGVVTFDCRNRGWYIQAATSPKDIVIVVDTSGSMKGLRMTIARHTIATILDTLGENDFVNVIAYSDYVRYVEPCFKGTLVQADRDNREHFKQLVADLVARGVGVARPALDEAFQILKQFQEARQGSLCNQAVMLVSDGAVEDYEPVFQTHNWPDRKVRVFTYLIGREVTFADRMKWIACSNKGYYTQISTLADTQENVMEYLHVLSRPMVINHDHDVIWTEAYLDSKLFTSQAQSVALLTTVAMPVFSKKNETRSHGLLLGVVGSDVTLRELMKLVPRYKLGVHGYAFLSTNNGYILSHPDLRPMYREGKKLKPKPNYNSVDLSEVELEDRAEILRTALINGETGSFSLDVKVPLDQGKRVLFLTKDYFFTDIKDTPFSLGVVLSRGHGEYILLGNTSVEEGLHDLLRPELSLASEWIYCITDIDPDHQKLSQLEAVVRFLTREDPDLECNEELVRQVLLDAVVTAPMEAYWTALVLNTSDASEDGVDMAFLGTRSGLLRSGLFVGSEKVSDKKFLTPEDEASVFTADRFPLWYRLAAEQPAGSFVFSIRSPEASESLGQPAVVTASTAVAVTVDEKTAVAAAVGVQMRLDFLQRRFWAVTEQCAGVDGPCPQSCQDSDLDCFVIDNNGFILVSERPQETGRFLGEVDGAVVSQLLSTGMFSRVTMYDYQAMCKPPDHQQSAARALASPLPALLRATRWLLDEVLLFLLEGSAWGTWRADRGAKAKAVVHHSHKHKKQDLLQPCDTEYPVFVHQPASQETSGLVECGACQKIFVMQQIPNSNLLLLVTDSTCDCSIFPPVLQEAKQVKYNASVKCGRMRSQKLRRRPESCHAFHPEENAQDCGGASDTSASLPLLLLSLGAWVLPPQLLQ
nr:voltage-dependent calcium channel subunit alpha-2/delta-4 [Dasypus novemcinctus]